MLAGITHMGSNFHCDFYQTVINKIDNKNKVCRSHKPSTAIGKNENIIFNIFLLLRVNSLSHWALYLLLVGLMAARILNSFWHLCYALSLSLALQPSRRPKIACLHSASSLFMITRLGALHSNNVFHLFAFVRTSKARIWFYSLLYLFILMMNVDVIHSTRECLSFFFFYKFDRRARARFIAISTHRRVIFSLPQLSYTFSYF